MAGADIVMLDNMQPEALRSAAQVLKEEFPQLLIEASGGITTTSISEYTSPHVDIISLGALTQGKTHLSSRSCLDAFFRLSVLGFLAQNSEIRWFELREHYRECVRFGACHIASIQIL